MLRSRKLWVLIVLLGIVALSVAPALGQGSNDVQQLQQRVTALENRIAVLERTLSQRLAGIERQLQQGGAAANAVNPQAEAAYAEISRLMAQGDYETARNKMADFMKNYGSTTTAKKARRMYEELSVIGKSVPQTWEVEKWFQGQDEVDLSGGKTTLVVFFEEWCPHCKREVPKLQSVYADLKGDGLQVVGFTKVTRSATDDKVETFIHDQKIEYPIAKETGSLSSYFNVSGIPAAVVVKDGKVVWRGHPAQLNEDVLKKWL